MTSRKIAALPSAAFRCAAASSPHASVVTARRGTLAGTIAARRHIPHIESKP